MVTATREPAPLDRVVADVVVIDAEEIRRTTADSVEDLLRRSAGVQLSRNGGPGQSASVLMRGSGANGSVVLVDGVRVVSATLGQAPLEVLSLSQIERIEVLRGPGSSLYGADAVGGVIRITTRRGAESADGVPDLHGLARFGSLSSSELAASLTGRQGGLDYSLGVAREASDGISAVAPDDRFGRYNPDADGFERRSVRAGLGLELVRGHRLSASVLDSRLDSQFDSAVFAPPDFAPDPSPDFRNQYATRVLALDYRGRVDPRWDLTLSFGAQRDDLRSGAPGTVERYVTDRRQFTWQNALRFVESQQWVLALDHVDESVDAASLGAVPDRQTTAGIVSWTGNAGPHRWQADLRHDRSSVDGSINTGKLGWGLDLGGGFGLRAVAGTAFRVPTFNDLYFPGYGVPTIRSERSRSVELGVDWSAAAAPDAAVPRVGATVYRNRVGDLIGYQPDPAQCPPGYAFGCAANVSDARLQGLTIEAQWPLWRDGGWAVDGRMVLDWLDARDLSTGEPLPRRAPNQQSVAVTGRRGPWSVDASLLGVADRPEGGQVLGSYQLLDLRLARAILPGLQAELRVNNALDARYQTALDYPGWPRQTWVGLRYDGGAPR